MNRRKLVTGSKFSLSDFLKNIQDDIALNMKNRISRLFPDGGLFLDVQGGNIQGVDFQVSVASSTELTINSGEALTKSSEYINFQTSTIDVIGSGVADDYYLVTLTYTQTGSEPVKIINGFNYDDAANAITNTKFADSYEISLTSLTNNIDDTIAGLSDDQLGLAVIYVTSNTISNSTFTLGSDTALNGIIDTRLKNRLTLAPQLLSDLKFLFKDRDNVGDFGITGVTDFNGDLRFKSILPVPGFETSEITTSGINLKNLIMETGSEQNTNIVGTSSSVFYVNGNPVLLGDGSLTTPRNLRLYDINPSPNHKEKYSIVTFKWNWDALSATPLTTTTIEIAKTNFNNETYTFADNNHIIGKRLYFSASDTSYEITGVASSTATEIVVQVDSDPTGESNSTSGSPARIIDSNVKDYTLQVTSTSGYINTYNLDSSYVKNPSFSTKLSLGESYSVTVQAKNVGGSSAVISMPSGSYDPDHANSGQAIVNYNSTFLNSLPPIDQSGSIDLLADAQGFNLKINDWADSGDPTNTAHSFEVIYSSAFELTPSSFDNLGGGDIEHQIIDSRTLHVSSGRPTNYSVAVRPLQNGYPVGDPIIDEVTSGGGGILPNETTIATTDVNIEVIETEIVSISGTWARLLYRDDVGNPVYPNQDFLRGRYITEGVNDYHISKVRDIYNDGTHLTYIDDITGLTTTTILKSGISKADRRIFEHSLEIDYIIKRIEFRTSAVTGVTQQDPGIIRVYQKGKENGAVTLEVPSFQTDPLFQQTSLEIVKATDGTRTLVIDAWDPDTVDPNNECEMAGEIVITGIPKVIGIGTNN